MQRLTVVKLVEQQQLWEEPVGVVARGLEDWEAPLPAGIALLTILLAAVQRPL